MSITSIDIKEFYPYQLSHIKYNKNENIITMLQSKMTPGVLLKNIKTEPCSFYRVHLECNINNNSLYIQCVNLEYKILSKKKMIKDNNIIEFETGEYDNFINIYVICNKPKLNNKFIIKKVSIEKCTIMSYVSKQCNTTDIILNKIIKTVEIKNEYDKLKDYKILITSTQYPGYGGAATNAYGLLKFLKEKGINVCGIFYDNSAIKNNINVDMDNIGGVYKTRLMRYDRYFYNGLMRECTTSIYKSMKDEIIQFLNGEPDISISFNYVAPIVTKYMFPSVINIYAVTGSSYLTHLPEPFIDYIQKDHTETFLHQNTIEKVCLNISDYILFNTNIMKNVFTKCYPLFKYKFCQFPLDLTNMMSYKLVNTPTERIYDICVITSRFDRDIKNIKLIKDIFSDKSISHMKKLAIGLYSNNTVGMYDNVTTFSLIEHKKVLEYISQCKILIMPSYFESASIVVREALLNNCLILSSNNIGLSDRLSEFFLCKSVLNKKEWIEKIHIIVNNFDVIKNVTVLEYDQTDKQIVNILDNMYTNYKPHIKCNILVTSVDTPYIGGSGTNSYRIIKYLRIASNYNVLGMYIDSSENNTDPDNIGMIYKFNPKQENLTDEYIKQFSKHILQESNIDKIDIVFAKNYKSVIITKKMFPHAKIIFSPSGSRFYTLYCSDNCKYIDYNTMYNNIENNVEYTYNNNLLLHDYLKQDRVVEVIANDIADIIVTNSLITYKLFKKLYSKYKHKLYPPISLSNICDNNTPCKVKKYDIIFMSYNWKRKVKNIDLLMDIINNKRLDTKRILIIGILNDKYTKKCSKNVSCIGLCNQKQVRLYLRQSNVIVMPSYYDSNPNSIVEAIRSGCKAVLSTNIGQYNYIPDECIVKDYYNLNEWIDKIEYTLNMQNFIYTGPDTTNVIIDIKNCLDYTYNNICLSNSQIEKNKNIFVSIYKVPPCWCETKYNINEDFIYNNSTENEYVENIISYDMFYKLTKTLSMELECDEYHYLIGDDNCKTSIRYDISNIYPNEGSIYIWKIANVSDLMKFGNGTYYFMRGLYHNIYKALIDNNNIAKLIHYRATSIPFNKQLTTCDIDYDVIIHDGNEDILRKIYNKSILIHFYKFAHSNFIFKNCKRIYDICFVATHKQSTKNHHLFMAFLRYCEKKRVNITAIYVGDYTKVKCFSNIDNEIKLFKSVKLILKKRLEGEEMVNLYNSSRINILFSGRDCNPRVITESLSCGCFNIALDTLSDGKWIYDSFFGELVGSKQVKIDKMKSYSICYIPSNIIFDQINKLINKEYDHKNIAIETYKKFNISINIKNIVSELNKIDKPLRINNL